MENINVFDEVKQGKFFKFEKVGDSIQGTYIDKMTGVPTKFGNQIVYILKDKEGNIWNVGIAENKLKFHARMDGIFLGQIVGFRFDETRPSDKGNDAKIIRIYADPKFVDHEWLAARKELEANSTMLRSAPSNTPSSTEVRPSEDSQMFNGKPFEFKVPEEAQPTNGSVPQGGIAAAPVQKNETLEAIRNLAKTKGLITAEMSEADGDKAIETYTGYQLTEENWTKVIVKLTNYKK